LVEPCGTTSVVDYKLLLSEANVHLDDGTDARCVRRRNGTPHGGKPRPGPGGATNRRAGKHQPPQLFGAARSIDPSAVCATLNVRWRSEPFRHPDVTT